MEETKTEKLNNDAQEAVTADTAWVKPEEAEAANAGKKRPWSTKKWLAFMSLLILIFILVPVVNEYIPQKVNVKYVTFYGEQVQSYWTRAHRVSEFIGEHKDEIGQQDVVKDLWSEGEVKKASEISAGSGADVYVSNEMEVNIVKPEETEATIAGKKQQINMYPGDVSSTLEYNGIDFDEDDVIKPALSEQLQSDDVIKLTRLKVIEKDKTLEIEPKEAHAVFDKAVASGTVMRSEGKPGKAVYTYTYKYKNGKKVRTSKKFKKWIKKPENIRLTFGTSETGETGEVNYSETFIGNCTAYYAGNNAHGATGQRCYYGTCAVDPSVIPYGTKLYVEGYGTAIANDCGGAVKGHIIDLYMRSTKECFQWGRRNRKVYVLN